MSDLPLLLTVIATTLYVRGAAHLRRPQARTITAGLLGFLTVLVALSPPFDEWSDRWFSAHMTQHLLLILIAAPLLELGHAARLTVRGLPLQWQRGINRVRRHHYMRTGVKLLALPAVVWTSHAVIVWTWHAPAFYEEALHHEVLHGAEHALFLFSALAFWNVVRHAGDCRGVSPGVAVIYLVAASAQGSALGAILLFARRPLYSSYPSLHDQQLAGLIMWLPATVIYLIGVAYVFIRWWRRTERTQELERVHTRAVRAVPLALVALGAFAGASIHQSPAAVAQPPTATENVPSTMDRGTFLYLRDCGICHGADGNGTTKAPSLLHAGAAKTDYMITTGRMPISKPNDDPQRSSSKYNADDTKAIVDKVASFGDGPPIPPYTGGDIAKGASAYRLNCAGCHGAVGGGGALTNGSQKGEIGHAPALSKSTPTQVLEAMRTGPGNMPEFTAQEIPDDQANEIAAYVQTLHDPVDRGGWALGHMGPVPEGAAGLFIGLALLVLSLRLIGTSAGSKS